MPESILSAVMGLRRQQTLRRSATVSGFGLWSGQNVRVEFRPAPAGAGIAFVRDDLPGVPADSRSGRIPDADPAAHDASVRRGGGSIWSSTILAVLYGMGVDNCEIGVNAQEMPGCDGSAACFADAIQEAGNHTSGPASPILA